MTLNCVCAYMNKSFYSLYVRVPGSGSKFAVVYIIEGSLSFFSEGLANFSQFLTKPVKFVRKAGIVLGLCRWRHIQREGNLHHVK